MKMLTTYPLFQYAYLVNDIEATIHKWAKVFGAGPFVGWKRAHELFRPGDNPIMAR